MSDPILYTAGKVGAAGRALATGRGRVGERLVAACVAGLYGMNPNAFRDPESRELATRVKNALFNQGRTVDLVVAAMDEDGAAKLAEDIVSLDARASHEVDILLDRRGNN